MTNEPHEEQQYLDIMRRILDTGAEQKDRTGVGTKAIFGTQMRYDLSKGFPLLTTKKLHLRSIIHELLWMLSGDTNIAYLQKNKVRIWDEWADENGDLGPVYGKQWRDWQTPDGQHIDQVADLIKLIKSDPGSRRQIVTSWNPSDNPKMALTPCHCLYQTFVANGKISLHLYQRSADFQLGVPMNQAFYALLTHMIAQQCDLEVGDLIWTGGDTHLYLNHLEQANLQITRAPYAPPKLIINRKPDSLFDYRYEDFEFVGYEAHPHIKATVAV